mmetsp:Transcript_4276/g.8654  ORF Transcript_4276/g.8654 Transcript_4276/m.8654 type:complete len:81 (-) Transcript_4276:403-645(-)|eukprot:CAMPEP_0118633782 /NCGR_PEP_ID=MMETSP0785-20121206/1184_1 /TAXON_ID=91992 /ORGANISM="Bolidomonas pacifica, Strain CCMP 1866" /LENGTH=80 /DNA_ID=CAMNT_0006524687 /DNA_START=174 /DNA_END=416 /DNA_ORIENTATION=+
MDQLNDVYQKRSFLGSTQMHMQAMDAQAELENFQEFSEEQQVRLKEVMRDHLDSKGEAIDERLTAVIDDVQFYSKIGEGR